MKIKELMFQNQSTNFLQKEHKGEAGFETMIITPFVFMMYFILMNVFFFGLTYVSFNNFANNVASKLDMRAVGYNDYDDPFLINENTRNSGLDKNLNSLTVNTGKGSYSFRVGGFAQSDIIEHSQPLQYNLGKAVYELSTNKGKATKFLNLPGARVTSIDAFADEPIDLVNSSKNIGTVIKVEIKWKPFDRMLFFDQANLEMKADGYTMIH